MNYPDCVKLCEHQNGRLPEEEFEDLASTLKCADETPLNFERKNSIILSEFQSMGFDVSNFHLPSNRSKFDCANFGFYVGAYFNFTSKIWNFKNSNKEIRKDSWHGYGLEKPTIWNRRHPVVEDIVMIYIANGRSDRSFHSVKLIHGLKHKPLGSWPFDKR